MSGLKKIVQRGARFGLGLGLFLLGCLKFATPYEPTVALPWLVYYVAATVEVVIGSVIIRDCAKWAIMVAVCFFAGSVFLTLAYDGDCG